MIEIMFDPLHELFTDAQELEVPAGGTVFETGARVRSVFMVQSGRVDLVRHLKSGDRLVLSRASAGQVLAEASVYAQRYHCDGVAAMSTRLKRVDVAVFRDRLDASPDLARAWARNLARVLQATRMSAEIRSLRTVAERLDAWLDTGQSVPEKGEWQGLAQELGVSREALYRELARRR